MRSVLRILLAGAAIGFTAPVAAEPALFVARDADTTIYLYGTIHAVQCGPANAPAGAATACVDWMTDEVEAALAAADELWVEATDIVDQAALLGLMQEYGYLPAGQYLTDFMPEDELRRLAGMAGPMGEAALPQLNTMMPWLVSAVLGLATLMEGGALPEEGVDLALTRIATERGTPIRGLETGAAAMELVATDPLGQQLADLRTMAVLVEHGVDIAALTRWSFEKLWSFWLAGDLDGVAQMLLGTDEAFFDQYEAELVGVLGIPVPELKAIEGELDALYVGLEDVPADAAERLIANYERVVAGRNRSWMPHITEMLARPGTFFVGVGTGHFTGDAALQTLVAQAGATVERIQ